MNRKKERNLPGSNSRGNGGGHQQKNSSLRRGKRERGGGDIYVRYATLHECIPKRKRKMRDAYLFEIRKGKNKE